MAERPLFIPTPDSPELVKDISLRITWHPGFAPSQKKKNVTELHEAAARAGYSPVLEVSTKSEEKVGQRMSGPYTDLYSVENGRDAKRDSRLKESGPLKEFRFESFSFPLESKTVFTTGCTSTRFTNIGPGCFGTS